MSFSLLRSLLHSAAQRAGITRDLTITTALRACQAGLVEIFGTEYSKFAEPIALRKDGALVIACRSPAVAQTIRLHETELLRTVRAASPSARVDRLFLVPRSRADLFTASAAAPTIETDGGA
ncbi:MAG: DciA family protein [Candidatus Uhrbacteria bacterium]